MIAEQAQAWLPQQKSVLATDGLAPDDLASTGVLTWIGTTSRHSIMTMKLRILLCLLVGLLVLFGLAPTKIFAQQATIPNTEIVLSIHTDGTESFDSDPSPPAGTIYAHTPGLDDNANNNVVRSYDSVQYRVDWNVNELPADDVIIRIALPADLEIQWLSTVVLPFAAPGCDTTLSSITPASGTSGEILNCYLGDKPEGTSGTIFPTMEVNGELNGTVIGFDATIETAATGPVTSNQVDVEVSAAPNWNFKKEIQPDVYRNVTLNGEEGFVFVYPISLHPSGTDTRGSEPLNDAVNLTFYDHLADLARRSTQPQAH